VIRRALLSAVLFATIACGEDDRPKAEVSAAVSAGALAAVDSAERRDDSTRAGELLAAKRRLARAELIAIDEIWRRRGVTVVPDSFHRRAVSARLDSAAILLELRPRTAGHTAGAQLQLAALKAPLTAAQDARYQKIQAQVRAREQAVQQAAEAANLAATARERRALAATLESRFLDEGMDVTVTTRGKHATTLHMRWILVSRVTAHQFSKNVQMFENLRAKGFKRLEISDGYDESWYWTL
jgi:hypothetical protein